MSENRNLLETLLGVEDLERLGALRSRSRRTAARAAPVWIPLCVEVLPPELLPRGGDAVEAPL